MGNDRPPAQVAAPSADACCQQEWSLMEQVCAVTQQTAFPRILTVMGDPQDKAAEYRQQAAACLEVAYRMSLDADRALLLEMAKRWLDLARQAQADAE